MKEKENKLTFIIQEKIAAISKENPFSNWRGLSVKEDDTKKTKEQVIEIKEEFDLPGTGITLEKGDKIKVLKEYAFWGDAAYDTFAVLSSEIKQNPQGYGESFVSTFGDYLKMEIGEDEMMMFFKGIVDTVNRDFGY